MFETTNRRFNYSSIVSNIRRNAHHLPHSLHGVGWGGVGWGGGMLTFPRPRSLDLAQDVDTTLTCGGGGGDVNVPSTTSLDLAHDVDATITWGGMGML